MIFFTDEDIKQTSVADRKQSTWFQNSLQPLEKNSQSAYFDYFFLFEQASLNPSSVQELIDTLLTQKMQHTFEMATAPTCPPFFTQYSLYCILKVFKKKPVAPSWIKKWTTAHSNTS